MADKRLGKTVSDIPFSRLCELFEKLAEAKKDKKRKILERFRESFCPNNSDDHFQFYRLILPQFDRERAVYGLKEAALAEAITQALGIPNSSHAKKLKEWRSAGGKHAGNFSLIVEEVCQQVPGEDKGLALGEINAALDDLSKCELRTDKERVLRPLLVGLNPPQVKWLVSVIMKELKLGISEKAILYDFHKVTPRPSVTVRNNDHRDWEPESWRTGEPG
ncbi:hypothetical protein CYMTET_52971, partial [Cymbomonas tetramitiformis]